MRQFISEKAPDARGLLKISGKDYRYLRQVLRIRVGDMVSVRIPDGALIDTTVCQIAEEHKLITLQICSDNHNNDGNKDSVTRGVQASSIQSEQSEKSGPDYYLFQYIPKPVKMEQIIKQAVECGIKTIVPVIGEYSQKSSVTALNTDGAKSERINRIIREARQQSGSPVETKVTKPLTTEEAIQFWKKELNGQEKESCAIVLWERNENTKSLKEVARNNGHKITKAAIAVGSEGGISPSEVALLNENGFTTVHFAGNILRCETASIFGIAALQTTIRNENE